MQDILVSVVSAVYAELKMQIDPMDANKYGS